MTGKNKNGKMTLEKLAGMVARGFDRSTIDLSEIKNKLGEHDRKFLEHDRKFSEHDKRFDKLEYKMDEIKDALERLEESDILNLQKRVQILEKAVRALAINQTSK